MPPIILERDAFINPAVGAEVSYHAIDWMAEGAPVTIPSGGNIHHHRLPAAGTTPHSHEFGELVFALSGGLVQRVNGERQPLAANSVAFLRPSDRHQFLPAAGNPPCELLLLSFHVEFFGALGQYLEEPSFLDRYTAGVLPAVFAAPERQMNEWSLELLGLNARHVSPLTRKIRFKVLLVDLFARFFLPPDDERNPAASRRPGWLNDLCERMRKPENFVPGLRRMQQLSGYTPEYLCKVFRRHLGQSPTEFLNELRINHAARLLADTDDAILSVAYDLNFRSLSRFYHLFKKQYGCTPVDYRRRARAAKKLI